MSEWTHGGVHFPLPTATGNTLLRDADPTIFYLLDFLAWGIRHYLGDRLVESATEAEVLSIQDAVQGSSSVDPAPYLLETQAQFPHLAVYRSESQFNDRTIARRQDVSNISVAYVLRPMTGAQAEQLVPILHAVKGLVDRLCESGRDPEYTPPGSTLGASIFRGDLTSLNDLICTSANFGTWPAGDRLHFPSIVLTLQATESSLADLTNGVQFTGANVALASSDGSTTVNNVSVTSIELPLRVTAVSPTSGPRSGGTIVTLTTTNAQAGIDVRFGTAEADVISVADDGLSVVVRTPALAAHIPDNYPAGVTVTGIDMQADRLPAAYTYVA